VRLVCADALAQALHRVAQGPAGLLLLPSVTDLETVTGLRNGIERCPVPDPGSTFYVGEAHDWTFAGREDGRCKWTVRYRAAGEQKFTRWHGARWMRSDFARTHLRVRSRTSLRLDELTEDHAARMGLPLVGDYYEGAPIRGQMAGRAHNEALSALQEWWPLWHGHAWDPRSWAFLFEVERA
jgi:hypothetical protein